MSPYLLIDGEPVRRISAAAAAAFRDKGATGGMRKKLRAAGEGLDEGVERVVIGSAPVSELLGRPHRHRHHRPERTRHRSEGYWT